jgi:signal transduction histidine kinase
MPGSSCASCYHLPPDAEPRELTRGAAGVARCLQSQTQAKLHLDCRLSSLALDAQKQVHLLQIVREAVLNAIKHAQASEITVSCVTARTVRTASTFAITASVLARPASRRDTTG